MSMPGPAGSGGLVVDVEQRYTAIPGVDGSARGFESYQDERSWRWYSGSDGSGDLRIAMRGNV